jgi:sigma-B regulation protein RsbU (phosphoserine phosphatase)
MEQVQFRVRIPLWVKFLLTVFALLATVVTFLTYRVLYEFNRDKEAYTFSTQGTQALLVGKEFKNLIQQANEFARVALGSFDPTRFSQEKDGAKLKDLLNNQSAISVFLVLNAKTSEVIVTSTKSTENELEVLFNAKKQELLKKITSSLTGQASSLVSVGVELEKPYLALAIADRSVIGVSFVSLQSFHKDLVASNLEHSIVADRNGQVLFGETGDLTSDAIFKQALTQSNDQGSLAFEQAGVRFLGSFYKPEANIIVLVRNPWAEVIRATQAIVEKTILLGLMSVGFSLILVFLFSKTLTAPLQKLFEGTREVSKGNFDLNVAITTRDEIGALTASFNVMAKRIRELIIESMEKVRLESEIKVASAVQQTLIPPPKILDEKVLIMSHYQSASQCGGDWWGVFSAQNKMALMIADATGHGIPSALVTAAARSCFSILHKIAVEEPSFSFSPAMMLEFANKSIFESANGQLMMTFFVAVIDFDTNEIKYSSAGHNPPWLFKKNDTGYELKSLMTKGIRLGEQAEPAPFEEKTLPIGPEDLVFMYTDGIPEGKSPERQNYGKQKMKRIVEQSVPSGPAAVVDNLIADFATHITTHPLEDDISAVAIKILGTHAASST